MKIERYGYWPYDEEPGRELLDELVVSDAKLIHIERLSKDEVFLGVYSDREGKDGIQIYFKIADNGILDWWFIVDAENPQEFGLEQS